jgi:hypothetical protein
LAITDAEYEAAFRAVSYGFFDLLSEACDRRTPVDGPLTKWERLALWLYTTTNGPWFNTINAPLREGRPRDAALIVVTECLASAVQKLPTHKGIVWRGIRVPDLAAFLEEVERKPEIVWRAFSSASIDETQADAGNVLFIIESHAGRRIGLYAEIWEEQEVLFVPGSRFRVVGLERTSTKAIFNLRQIVPVAVAPTRIET